MTLEELYKIIQERKTSKPDESYVASLFKDGTDRIVQKVGEEAIEVVIAAKSESKEQIISEIADLWFHTLVLLSNLEIKPSEILEELEKRRIGRQ
jgi:phosphoribosyl-ATP pyrophosphohydrolase